MLYLLPSIPSFPTSSQTAGPSSTSRRPGCNWCCCSHYRDRGMSFLNITLGYLQVIITYRKVMFKKNTKGTCHHPCINPIISFIKIDAFQIKGVNHSKQLPSRETSNILVLPAGTFESMMFRLPWRICHRSLEDTS